jgi:coenzyme F420-reducing hydrogenase alpha subunit
VDAIRRRLEALLPDAEALVTFCGDLDLPDERQVFTSVSLTHPSEYAVYEGQIISGEGLNQDAEGFGDAFELSQVPHSTALHAHIDGRPYLVGPLARVNLNLDQLPAEVRGSLPVRFPSHNVFHSLLARAVEIHTAVVECLRLLEGYRRPEAPAQPVRPSAGRAVAASEAPRGLLWQSYRVDDQGRVVSARILPPTSQNLARIEEDLRESIRRLGAEWDEAALRSRAEQVIRNYDPCISCATHFLRLRVVRR